MPIRSAALTFAKPSCTRERRRCAGPTRRWLAALVGTAAFVVSAAPASAAELLTNGGFETGTFSGWTTTTLTNPLTPWTVATVADSGYFVAASPQEGTYDALNGFDGDGPGGFTLSQTVSIPAGETVLSWKDRIQYAMNQAAAARLLEVKILDPGTDAVLATVYTFTTGPGDGTCCSIPPGHDAGWQAHLVDLSAFGGQTVKLVFDETIPGNFTGPGQIEFDAISVMSLLSAGPGTLAFGSRDVGDGPSATQESTLTNATGATVTLSRLTIAAADPTQFALRSAQAGDCTNTTVLAAGEACDVGVTFDPTTAGAKAATLTFASDEPDVTVALTGTGTDIDTDGDGIGNSVDTDDDGDGTEDTADAFPLDPAESVDTDGDGIGNNTDTDDDGDGVADSADAFPLDSSRQAAPTPPRPRVVQPWTLQTRAKAKVTRRTTGLLVSTGLAALCPAGAPACSGRLTLKVMRRSPAGTLRPLFLTGKVKVTTVAAGTERRITFRLNQPGSRLLRRLGSFTATLRGVVAVGRNRPIVRTATLRISAPR